MRCFRFGRTHFSAKGAVSDSDTAIIPRKFRSENGTQVTEKFNFWLLF